MRPRRLQLLQITVVALASLRTASAELRRRAIAHAAKKLAAIAVPVTTGDCSASPTGLAMFDRAKHRGLLIELGESSAVGCWLDERDGRWRATLAGAWIA